MKIEVRRKDESIDFVEDYFLQLLIDMNDVVAFKRSSGWVIIGQDPIRRRRTPFAGQDKRIDFSTLDPFRPEV